jgi:hypothetical protein
MYEVCRLNWIESEAMLTLLRNISQRNITAVIDLVGLCFPKPVYLYYLKFSLTSSDIL